MSEFTELFQLDNLINEVETRYLSKLIILMSDIILEEKKNVIWKYPYFLL